MAAPSEHLWKEKPAEHRPARLRLFPKFAAEVKFHDGASREAGERFAKEVSGEFFKPGIVTEEADVVPLLSKASDDLEEDLPMGFIDGWFRHDGFRGTAELTGEDLGRGHGPRSGTADEGIRWIGQLGQMSSHMGGVA